MNLIPGFGWLKTVTTQRDVAEPTPDAGDMGTAFGLDACIEPLSEQRAAPVPGHKAVAPWNQRLVRRPQR